MNYTQESIVFQKTPLIERDKPIFDKRVVMLTVCLSSQVLNPNRTSDVLAALNDAIVGFVSKLKPNDFLCVNIGNSGDILEND